MNFRAAPGTRIAWIDTRMESGFSNFLYIDRHYRSHPVLRRIFSLARVVGYQSLLIERLEEDTCTLLAEENAALRIRRPDFANSVVHRLTFWRCSPDAAAAPTNFIGYAVFKSDQFRGASQPKDHVYESVLPSVRLEDQNNFIHCRRHYAVQTCVGPQTVTGVLYAQQNDLTFVCRACRLAHSPRLPRARRRHRLCSDVHRTAKPYAALHVRAGLAVGRGFRSAPPGSPITGATMNQSHHRPLPRRRDREKLHDLRQLF